MLYCWNFYLQSFSSGTCGLLMIFHIFFAGADIKAITNSYMRLAEKFYPEGDDESAKVIGNFRNNCLDNVVFNKVLQCLLLHDHFLKATCMFMAFKYFFLMSHPWLSMVGSVLVFPKSNVNLHIFMSGMNMKTISRQIFFILLQKPFQFHS